MHETLSSPHRTLNLYSYLLEAKKNQLGIGQFHRSSYFTMPVLEFSKNIHCCHDFRSPCGHRETIETQSESTQRKGKAEKTLCMFREERNDRCASPYFFQACTMAIRVNPFVETCQLHAWRSDLEAEAQKHCPAWLWVSNLEGLSANLEQFPNSKPPCLLASLPP